MVHCDNKAFITGNILGLIFSVSLFLSKIPRGANSLPKVEQMIETGKESVTEMTSFQAGIYSRLEQIHDFVSSGVPLFLLFRTNPIIFV